MAVNNTPIKKSTQKRRETKEKQKKEKIDSFDDPNNKYISIIYKRIRTYKKKLKQNESVQSKLEKGDSLQQEQMDKIQNRPKLEYTLSELEKIFFQIKEIGYREQKESTNKLEQLKKKNNNEIKKVKANAMKEANKVHEEVEVSYKKQLDKVNKDLSNIENTTKENTIKLLLEAFYANQFIRSLDKDEYILLKETLCKSYDHKINNIFEENCTALKKFTKSVFGDQSYFEETTSFKDGLTKSIQISLSCINQSEDPIDSVYSDYSFKRVHEFVQMIVKSPLFYNRRKSCTNLHERIQTKPFVQNTEDSNTSDLKNEDTKTNGVSFSVPKNVPVSSAKEKTLKDVSERDVRGSRGRYRGRSRRSRYRSGGIRSRRVYNNRVIKSSKEENNKAE